MKKEIRNQCIKIENESTYERDIANSQPFFLAKLLKDENIKYSSDIQDYINDVLSGLIYDKIAEIKNISRKETKTLFYEYLFGSSAKTFKEFQEKYVSVSKFIRQYKRKNYKSLSHKLQRLESDFIFNSVCKRLVGDDVRFYTIHDSIVVKQSDKSILDEVFDSEFNKLKSFIELF